VTAALRNCDDNQPLAAMPKTDWIGGLWFAIDPRNGAPPKAKTPPSCATVQWPAPFGSAAMPITIACTTSVARETVTSSEPAARLPELGREC
jgi:hypothetical protein